MEDALEQCCPGWCLELFCFCCPPFLGGYARLAPVELDSRTEPEPIHPEALAMLIGTGPPPEEAWRDGDGNLEWRDSRWFDELYELAEHCKGSRGSGDEGAALFTAGLLENFGVAPT